MASDQADATGSYNAPGAAYDRRAPDDRRYGRGDEYERSASGSSAIDRDRASDFRQMSDRDLRDQLYRLDDEERQIRRDRQAVQDELDRRGGRR
jgi:hypothetical protein